MPRTIHLATLSQSHGSAFTVVEESINDSVSVDLGIHHSGAIGNNELEQNKTPGLPFRTILDRTYSAQRLLTYLLTGGNQKEVGSFGNHVYSC